MNIKDLIANKEFMSEFVELANSSYQNYGSYEDVYMSYEDKMSDEAILALLDYCEANELLEY
jgi:hypothetical protein